MKIRNHTFAAILLGLGLVSVSSAASARDHDRHDHGWGHEHYARYYGPYDHRHDVRVVERRYVVREAPHYYYEPVRVRPAPVYQPVYRSEPGVVVSIGLPPIIIPFH